MKTETNKRVLVVANRTAAVPRLLDEVHRRSRSGPCEFALLIPGGTQSDWTLEDAVPMLRRAAGGAVEGLAGDVQEAVCDGRFDEIIVSTRSSKTSKWLRRDLVHRLRRLGLPVTAVLPRQTATGASRTPRRSGAGSSWAAVRAPRRGRARRLRAAPRIRTRRPATRPASSLARTAHPAQPASHGRHVHAHGRAAVRHSRRARPRAGAGHEPGAGLRPARAPRSRALRRRARVRHRPRRARPARGRRRRADLPPCRRRRRPAAAAAASGSYARTVTTSHSRSGSRTGRCGRGCAALGRSPMRSSRGCAPASTCSARAGRRSGSAGRSRSLGRTPRGVARPDRRRPGPGRPAAGESPHRSPSLVRIGERGADEALGRLRKPASAGRPRGRRTRTPRPRRRRACRGAPAGTRAGSASGSR